MDSPFSILIIEDDPAMARSLKEALVGEGFRPDWAATGADGLQQALARNPHLILLDVRLPDGSGFDLCRQMRQLALRQPILFLTARNEELDKVLGLEMGADDYLTKPFGMRELLSRVRALLRRAYGELAAPAGERLYAGDLTIDLGRGRVLRGEHEIPLSPTEYRLLVYLAHHPGLVLTRAQIIENVWGYDPGAESERIVNVQIRRLREKIEPDPSHPSLILTVPGIGYRLHQPKLSPRFQN
jgi:DNA-binding response OmpR family regulator